MRGHDLRNFCRDLLAHFRDLLVAKVSGSQELLESAICDAGGTEASVAQFSESDLVRFFHSLAETETLLKTAAHPRYQLEVGLVKLMEMRRLESLNQLLERLATLEESVRTGKAPSILRTKAPSSSNAVLAGWWIIRRHPNSLVQSRANGREHPQGVFRKFLFGGGH